MSNNVIAERDFDAEDQERFAALSGDRNPMHMDPVAARRTIAGAPVVHGIHTVLWSLDRWVASRHNHRPVASLKVVFMKMIYVGDHVQLLLRQQDETAISLSVVVDGVRAISFRLQFGGPCAEDGPKCDGLDHRPAEPLDLGFEELDPDHGFIGLDVVQRDDVRNMFPAATAFFGFDRVAELACASYLVGMVYPGLHSLFAGLHLRARWADVNHRRFNFRVAKRDARFRLITMAVSGDGWSGTVDAHMRPSPVDQAEMATIAGRMTPGEMNGTSVLVVGGSRGLGELIAKIAAAGGAHVTLTYAVGEGDARKVQTAIRVHGGLCDIMQYDVRDAPCDQWAKSAYRPNQVYFLATPHISRRKGSSFDRERLDEFMSFYVDAFSRLYRDIRSRSERPVSFFFPSTVFLDECPSDFIEYTMAKAAAEVLCRHLNALEPPGTICVHRLPPLATDQTASVRQRSLVAALDVILPIVREVNAAARPPPVL